LFILVFPNNNKWLIEHGILMIKQMQMSLQLFSSGRCLLGQVQATAGADYPVGDHHHWVDGVRHHLVDAPAFAAIGTAATAAVGVCMV
jgi:hypothetical protein